MTSNSRSSSSKSKCLPSPSRLSAPDVSVWERAGSSMLLARTATSARPWRYFEYLDSSEGNEKPHLQLYEFVGRSL